MYPAYSNKLKCFRFWPWTLDWILYLKFQVYTPTRTWRCHIVSTCLEKEIVHKTPDKTPSCLKEHSLWHSHESIYQIDIFVYYNRCSLLFIHDWNEKHFSYNTPVKTFLLFHLISVHLNEFIHFLETFKDDENWKPYPIRC